MGKRLIGPGIWQYDDKEEALHDAEYFTQEPKVHNLVVTEAGEGERRVYTLASRAQVKYYGLGTIIYPIQEE